MSPLISFNFRNTSLWENFNCSVNILRDHKRNRKRIYSHHNKQHFKLKTKVELCRVECGTFHQRMELSAGLFIKEWSRVRHQISKSRVVRNGSSKNGVECGTVYQRMEQSAELFIKERSRVRNCLLKRGRDECGNQECKIFNANYTVAVSSCGPGRIFSNKVVTTLPCCLTNSS